MIVDFEDLANMILSQGKAVRGFVINPMGDNICFTQEMIQGMICLLYTSTAGVRR